MNTIRELKPVLKEYVDNHYRIDEVYLTWETYAIENKGAKVVQITMRDTYYDKRSQTFKNMSKKKIQEAFDKLIIETNAEVLSAPYNSELGYDDCLRLLYHHYPFGDGNFTNCAIINVENQILAIQYNWCENTRFIHVDVINPPKYVVLNNKKKLDWVYFIDSLQDILNACANINFN